MEVVLVPKEFIEVAPVEKAVFSLANVSATVAGPKGDKGDTGDTGPQGPPGEQGTPGLGLEDTDDLPEGVTNLYYTNERVDARVTKSAVGLSNVPNLDTTDAVNNQHTHSNKTTLDAITEAFTTAFKSAYDGAVTWISTNGSSIINHLSNTSNPHSVTKSQVGLSNVDNTSDVNKPISSATQTALNAKQDSLGYTAENSANKSTSVVTDQSSATKYPTVKSVYDWVTGLGYITTSALTNYLQKNTAITGATKTKITYDANGLVTSGTDATTADIADSTNKRYVTDAQLVVIGNTSGTNTGNQTSIVGITGTKAQFDTAVTDGNIMYIGDAPTAHTHPQSEITNLVTDLAGKQPTLSLTTIGSSGAATLVGATLNIPQYTGGGGGGTSESLVIAYAIALG